MNPWPGLAAAVREACMVLADWRYSHQVRKSQARQRTAYQGTHQEHR